MSVHVQALEERVKQKKRFEGGSSQRKSQGSIFVISWVGRDHITTKLGSGTKRREGEGHTVR